MIRLRPFLLGLLAALFVFQSEIPAAEQRLYREASHGAGTLEYVDGIPVLTLEGTPEQIGRQHAALALQPIKPMLDLPKQVLGQHGGGLAWPLVGGVARTMLNNAPQRFRTELEAAVRASELDWDAATSVYVANALIELRRMGGCSALIVEPERSATGEMLFGRNFDFPPFGGLQRLSVVIIVRPEGKHAFASVGFPSLFGVLSGMNEKGLAVATLDVYASNDGSAVFNAQGTPLALTYRRILEECSTIEEAESLLKAGSHTTWMNLAACDTRRAVVFEITPENVVTRPAEAHLLACTNHFRTPQLCTSKECRRYTALERCQDQEQLGLAQVAESLHAVNQGEMTLQTMVFEPKSLRLHLAIGDGPTSAKPLTVLDLRTMLAR